MLTIMVLFCILLMAAILVTVGIGFAAMLPGVLIVIILILLDYFVIKLIFGRRKKNKD